MLARGCVVDVVHLFVYKPSFVVSDKLSLHLMFNVRRPFLEH